MQLMPADATVGHHEILALTDQLKYQFQLVHLGSADVGGRSRIRAKSGFDHSSR